MIEVLTSAECLICGTRVSLIEAPLHMEDHRQAGELVPCTCGAQLVRPYPNDTGEHSTTECPTPPEPTAP